METKMEMDIETGVTGRSIVSQKRMLGTLIPIPGPCNYPMINRVEFLGVEVVEIPFAAVHTQMPLILRP